MKVLNAIILCIAASCSDGPGNRVVARKELLPDTARTWSGQMTKAALERARLAEQRLHLEPLADDTVSFELRIWNTASFYDPQTLLDLKQTITGTWQLQTLSYDARRSDSLLAAHYRALSPAQVHGLELDRLWKVTSQSDLKGGDSFGCTDGADLFLELADATRHKLLWFRCPGMNAPGDSNILRAQRLFEKVRWLSELDTD